MGATVTRRITPRSRFAQSLLEAAHPQIMVKCQAIADDAVRRAEELAERHFDLNRPTARRRTPGSRRVKGSFSARVISTPGSFPVRIVLHSASPIFNILDKGSASHDIRPSNKASIRFPRQGGGWVTVPFVGDPHTQTHPGTTAAGIFRRALGSAVQAGFRQQAKIVDIG